VFEKMEMGIVGGSWEWNVRLYTPLLHCKLTYLVFIILVDRIPGAFFLLLLIVLLCEQVLISRILVSQNAHQS